jgi:hypothetical protein
MSGSARAVKWACLRSMWLSAFESSNLSPRINIFLTDLPRHTPKLIPEAYKGEFQMKCMNWENINN